MEKHHIIPISMVGEHTNDNRVEISKKTHKRIHETQDVKYSVIRSFRERTNHILVPNDYYWGEYQTMTGEYFRKAHKLPKELSVMQINSLLKQANNPYQLRYNHGFDTNKLIMRALELYIQERKSRIEAILCNGSPF